MKNLKAKIQNLFNDDLFINNKEAAYRRNKKILTIVLKASICCYIILITSGFFSAEYSKMRASYIIVLSIFCVILFIVHFLNDKEGSIAAYIIHFVFVGFCTYNSAFIWSDDICVMFLSELFILSTLLLDKSLRITVIAIVSGAIYLFVISFFKDPYHFADETVNVICFTLLSCIVGIFTRNTQLKNFDSIEQLRLSQERYKLAVKHSSGIVCEYNVENKCVIMTQDVADIFNAPTKVYDVPYAPVKSGAISPQSSDTYIQFYEGILNGNKFGTAEFECMTAKGKRWQKSSYSTIFSDNGQPVSAVLSLVDITEQKEKEKIQKEKAELDGLTGIYNRTTAETLINNLIAIGTESPYALMIADLDNLKEINDTLGHPQGDKAIKALANALKSSFRDNDIVGRIGGDEFIVFFSGINTEKQILERMDTIRERIAAADIYNDKNRHLCASMGIAFETEDKALSFNQLYAMADKALYKSKRNGKNCSSFYEE